MTTTPSGAAPSCAGALSRKLGRRAACSGFPTGSRCVGSVLVTKSGAALPQSGLKGRPVRQPVAGFRNKVSTIGVVFVRHAQAG